MTSSQPRYDYYQTDTAVNLSVFVKGLTDNDVDIKFGEHSLSLTLHAPSAPAQSLDVQLHDDIDGSNSSFKVLSTKVDILLKKKNPGRRWPNLESQAGGGVPSYEAATASSASTGSSADGTLAQPSVPASSSAAASRPRSKWDTLKLDEDEDGTGSAAAGGDASAAKGSEGGIDAFFQKLYADADDDTKRAMMKSYQESGGTSLSTNWSEVGKGKMETKAPEGMEARKW